ncbi:MAG: CDP-archaeol synthase [Gammaproteobacteria bacterium]|jgi:phosphatidate cytidylyltransferase|nr:CDP-archaeol synthase [Gammaproteobacteria bacterium]
MLGYRILTAAILIPLVLWAVLYLNGIVFALVCAGVFSLGALEWCGFCQFQSKLSKALFLLCFLLTLGIIYFLNSAWILMLGALLWLAPVYWVLSYQGQAPLILQSNIAKACIGILMLSLACYGLIAIKRIPHGGLWIILLFVLVWSTDTFAYFIGRKWGKTPLAALISPKKTLAGFWGGLLGAMSTALLAFSIISFQINDLPSYAAWMSIAYITILLAVIGDLFESLIKRLTGVKDSGNLLPGHGGILDRLDSLIAALPFYALSLLWVCNQGL